MSKKPSILVGGYIREMVISAVTAAEVRTRLLIGLIIHRVSPNGTPEPLEGWHRALVPEGRIAYFASAERALPPGLTIGSKVRAVIGRSGDEWELRSIGPALPAGGPPEPGRRRAIANAIRQVRGDRSTKRPS